MTRWIKLLLATVTLSAVAACGGHDDEPKNVLQTAESDSRFSILVEALKVPRSRDILVSF